MVNQKDEGMAKDKNLAAAPPDSAPAPSASVAPAHKPSTGERLFNRSIYGAFNFTGTLIVSVPLSAVVMFSNPRFRRGFDKMVGELAKWREWSPKDTKTVAVGIATWIGGTIVAIPVGWAKRHKPQVVNWLN